MITYVDTSSLLKLLIDEEGSERAELIWDTADVLAGSALIVVEARAALAAAERGARLTAAQHREARSELAALVDELSIVEVTEPVAPRDIASSERVSPRKPKPGAKVLSRDSSVGTAVPVTACGEDDMDSSAANVGEIAPPRT